MLSSSCMEEDTYILSTENLAQLYSHNGAKFNCVGTALGLALALWAEQYSHCWWKDRPTRLNRGLHTEEAQNLDGASYAPELCSKDNSYLIVCGQNIQDNVNMYEVKLKDERFLFYTDDSTCNQRWKSCCIYYKLDQNTNNFKLQSIQNLGIQNSVIILQI